MQVLITGSSGFVGRNLCLQLSERKDIKVIRFEKENSLNELPALVSNVDFVFHLAGVNRPKDPQDFFSGNSDLTKILCNELASVKKKTGRVVPVLYTSSIQADKDNPYGLSKLQAESELNALTSEHGIPTFIFRLPNVFGKWCRPNYNSAVATFCHNIARGLPIQINDPSAPVTLVYIDDVIENFISVMDGNDPQRDVKGFASLNSQYTTTVGELARNIESFKDSRTTTTIERVGTGLLRALYSTYVSYLPTDKFSYTLPMHADPRGVFVEMLKTNDSGQFSYFTAYPGVTRGGHYHHTKTEKFLVIKGQACFKFRSMDTGETYELYTRGDKAEIVETVPGWTHDITNVGTDEMIVMLWANEVFDRERPDTFACPI